MEIPVEGKAKHVFLGKSGLKVSNICLGTLTFGESILGHPGQSNEEMSHKILDRFTEWGGNFIDTADLYGFGESEKIVGTWLEKQSRENLVIATKCFYNIEKPSGDSGALPGMSHSNMANVNAMGLSRRHITASIEASLERLRTNYIDLYQTHIFDNAVPLEETYRTMDDLVRCGKVRYVGASNVSGWQMQKILQTQKELGLNPIVSLQQQYSLASRESELEAFQVCKTEGVAVLPWSPLKGGLLTGKVRRGQKPTEGRMGWVSTDEKSRHHEVSPSSENIPHKMHDVVEAAEAIGKKYGRTIAQVCLRWLIQRDVVASPVVGARTLEQLDQNMGVNGWSLTADEMRELDDLSAPPLAYPYQFIYTVNNGRDNPHYNNYFVQSTS